MSSKLKILKVLRSQLESERSSFISHWRELSEYILPRRSRFFTSDANRGDRRSNKIIDSTATLAARTMRSGMMSGITSPARPWFRLTTSDQSLSEYQAVKEWLHIVGQNMTDVFLKSNLYNCLPTVYGDLGTFGTAAMIVEEDFKDVLRCYPFPIGSYSLANNEKLEVNIFSREFRMTVRQLIAMFGKEEKSSEIDWTKFSERVKSHYDNDMLETWVDVCHVIQPNPDYDEKMGSSKHKKFMSCYYEKGSQTEGSNEKYLRESGYDYFPILAPRWEITGEDVYGTECPGMSSLGDIKALQTMHKRKAQAIEKMVNPPMTAPVSLQNKRSSILPGDITYLDVRDGGQGFKPAHEINFRINELLGDINDHQSRIKRAFYEDLFLMLSSSDRRQITAREIEERHEEKLLALGPVLEQLNQDLLDPLIDIAFDIMLRQGLIPPAPQELHGKPLKVEYISIMAQAQKLVGISSIERFAGFVGQIAQFNPNALDKIDTDQVIDTYGEMTSVPPSIVRSDEAVAQIRAQKQQAQQAQAQMQGAQAMAGTAKQLSETKMDEGSVLSAIMGGK